MAYFVSNMNESEINDLTHFIIHSMRAKSTSSENRDAIVDAYVKPAELTTLIQILYTRTSIAADKYLDISNKMYSTSFKLISSDFKSRPIAI